MQTDKQRKRRAVERLRLAAWKHALTRERLHVAIRDAREADSLTLREIAAAVGLSVETVRKITMKEES